MRDEAIRNGTPQQRILVVPYFTAELVRNSSPPAIKTIEGKLLFLGRMSDVKGLEVLVDAVPRAERKLGRRLSILAAGEGAERASVLRKARLNGVQIELRSWVTGAEKEALLRAADLLVVPSLWPEPFGIVGIEAASIGLPAAAFAQGGITEWLLPGVSGELSHGLPTSEGLATAITRALADSTHHQRLRNGAWETALRFSATAHLRGLQTALHSL